MGCWGIMRPDKRRSFPGRAPSVIRGSPPWSSCLCLPMDVCGRVGASRSVASPRPRPREVRKFSCLQRRALCETVGVIYLLFEALSAQNKRQLLVSSPCFISFVSVPAFLKRVKNLPLRCDSSLFWLGRNF